MKKKLAAIFIATAMTVAGTASATAATPAPSIKKPSKAAGEGTATHEMSETSETQKSEGTGTDMKKGMKKVAKKASKIHTPKPKATN